MGGIGSGNGFRGGSQTTTNNVRGIDIRFMKKSGLLEPGTEGSLNWTCGEEPWGEIRYFCDDHELDLHYHYRERDGDWQPMTQHISFDRTPCHYGGERLWFLCPDCHKRVAILYGADVLFLCRHCHQLPYASQNQDSRSNLIDQKHKLGERIFEDYSQGTGFIKKKGMHWKTFYRLHAEYEQMEERWCSATRSYLDLL